MIHKAVKDSKKTVCGINTGIISPNRKSYHWNGRDRVKAKPEEGKIGIVNCPQCLARKPKRYEI